MLLYWALFFLCCAILLGILGFGILAAATAAILKIIFWVFVVLFVVTLVSHATRRRI